MLSSPAVGASDLEPTVAANGPIVVEPSVTDTDTELASSSVEPDAEVVAWFAAFTGSVTEVTDTEICVSFVASFESVSLLPAASVAEIAIGANVRGLALSPDGTQLWATSLGDLLVVDPAQGSIVTRLALGGTAGYIAFDPAGTTAFVSNDQGWVDVIR